MKILADYREKKVLEYLNEIETEVRALEIGDYVIDSVLRIRVRLIHDLEEIRSDSVLRESLLAMSAACRKFMDENPRST